MSENDSGTAVGADFKVGQKVWLKNPEDGKDIIGNVVFVSVGAQHGWYEVDYQLSGETPRRLHVQGKLLRPVEPVPKFGDRSDAERGSTPHATVSQNTVTLTGIPLTGEYIFWRWRNDPEAKCRPVIRSFVERQEGRVVLLTGTFIPENTGPGKYFVDLGTIDIIGVDSVK